MSANKRRQFDFIDSMEESSDKDEGITFECKVTYHADIETHDYVCDPAFFEYLFQAAVNIYLTHLGETDLTRYDWAHGPHLKLWGYNTTSPSTDVLREIFFGVSKQEFMMHVDVLEDPYETRQLRRAGTYASGPIPTGVMLVAPQPMEIDWGSEAGSALGMTSM